MITFLESYCYQLILIFLQMRRFFVILLGVLSLTFIPGCLDIEEEIFLRSDGSGTYVNRVDVKKAIEFIMMMSSEEDRAGMTEDEFLDSMMNAEDMVASFATMQENYASMEGISDAKMAAEDGVITLRFDFTGLETLSAALQGGGISNQLGMAIGTFTGKKGLIARGHTKIDMDSEENAELQEQMDMLKMMMGEASYVVRYHFPGKVKKSSDPDATLLDGGKTLVIETKLVDLLEDPAVLDHEISYKNK